MLLESLRQYMGSCARKSKPVYIMHVLDSSRRATNESLPYSHTNLCFQGLAESRNCTSETESYLPYPAPSSQKLLSPTHLPRSLLQSQPIHRTENMISFQQSIPENMFIVLLILRKLQEILLSPEKQIFENLRLMPDDGPVCATLRS